MHNYPIFLNMTHMRCLVVGAGAVGRRKISGLLEAGAEEIRVLSLSVPGEILRPLLLKPEIRFAQRAFEPADVTGCALVCAATNDRHANAAIAEACREQRIFCTVSDAPELGSFVNAAHVEHKGLHAALTTGGHPALAQRIKKDLAAWLPGRYDRQHILLERLRPLLRADENGALTQQERAFIFRRLADANMNAALNAGDRGVCEHILRETLAQPYHSYISELLHELV